MNNNNPDVPGRKLWAIELFELDILSNAYIKHHRAQMGMETPNNRIDQGDLKMILAALDQMGFVVVKKDPDENRKENG